MAGSKRTSWHAVMVEKSRLARRLQRFSVAEHEATKNVTRMVQLLVEIAEDKTIDVSVRRLAALDLIERSDGKVAQKVEVARTVDEGLGGVTLDHEVEAAIREVDLLAEAERWISSGTDPSTWPQHIQDRFGPEALLALAEPDGHG